jgi:uncharacterized protein (TIGR03437 family)
VSLGRLLILAQAFAGLLDAQGIITTVAGNGTFGSNGDGGLATSAELQIIDGVAVDNAGNIYIADSGRIRKVNLQGTITTIAGTGAFGFNGDGGPAVNAQLAGTAGVAVDSSGNVYIADIGNHRIRMVNPAGIISTVAGNGNQGFSGDGGPATSAQLTQPADVAVDGIGNLYIADGTRIRKVNVAGIITTIAGNGTMGFSGDGGPARAAQLVSPRRVAADSSGNVYIADSNRVRKVTAAGGITTLAGDGSPSFGGDGGPANSAQINAPSGLGIDGAGNLYIADFFDNRIRKVSPSGIIATIAGSGVMGFSGDGGPAVRAQMNNPSAVAVSRSGESYIADRGNARIRKVTAAAADIVLTITSGDKQIAQASQAFPLPLVVRTVDSQGNPVAGAIVSWTVVSGVATLSSAFATTDSNGQASITVVAGTSGPIGIAAIAGGLSVTFSLSPAPNCTPAKLLITSGLGGLTFASGFPVAVTVRVADDCGTAQNLGMVTANISNGDTPVILTPAGGGNWTGTWTPLHLQPQVTLTVSASASQSSGVVLFGSASFTVMLVAKNGPPLIRSINTAFGSPDISQNDYIEIHGTNLSQGILGPSPLLPQLDGVTVTVNGNQALLYYVSPIQINALTPLDSTTGLALVVVTVNGATAGFTVNLRPVTPAFLKFDIAGHVTATHADGKFVGPPPLGPGFTPVAPGEEFVIYAVGFGLPSTPVAAGSLTQFGQLPVLPVCTIGSVPVNVVFAGLNGFAGLYQINLIVPMGAVNGDNPVSCTYGGQMTPPGTVLSVQR